LRAVLARQRLDEILSSGALRGLPGWVPGWPDAPRFAHKTGTTDNYASDAGIVAPDPEGRGHCIVAVLTTLGRRFAAHERAATTWRLPALGAAVFESVQALWPDEPAPRG
jgi:beta-lactamase class A